MAAMEEQVLQGIGTVIFKLGNLDTQMPSASQQYINDRISTHSN
jgi:hypothetical protein